MTPSNYITQPILDICRQSNQIVIIGSPCSGKTSIASFLSEQLPRPYILTDDYQNNLDKLLMDLTNYNKPLIVEGTLGYRLLRKGLQTQTFIPDLIIKLECNDKTITHLYNKYRDPNKLNYVKGMINGLNKIWEGYIELHKLYQAKTKCIEINTSLSYL